MDESLMQRCLDLASLGLGKVSPNPLVGSVIVWEGKIIGEGWHQGFGLDHAEVNAIREALNYLNIHFPESRTETSNRKFSETTLYVSLEPCSHFGKTPPCADLIIYHGIKRIVIGCMDTNPMVGGKGMQKLKNAGLEVEYGILEEKCRLLNKRFFINIQEKRPYIILKWAETHNGYLAPLDNSPYWISSPITQRLNHRWRTEEDAILVGSQTALKDNPRLTSRFWHGRNPIRILIDWNLKVPATHHINDDTMNNIIVNGKKSEKKGSIHYSKIENKQYLIEFMLYELHLNDIGSLIVEGGLITLNKFLELNLWDEIRIIRSAKTFDEGIKSPLIPDLDIQEVFDLNEDQIIIGINKKMKIK